MGEHINEKEDRGFSASLTISSTITTPSMANGMGNVHGGEIVKIMDTAAGIAAMKHARTNCVTARIDKLIFYHPAHVGDIIECAAQVVYAGNTSMQVYVTLHKMSLKQDKTRLLSAFFTMVAVDWEGKPTKVPALAPPDTEEEKALHAEGEKRARRIAEKRKREREKPVAGKEDN